MNYSDLPVWTAIVVSILVLTGSGITLIGTIGLLRMNNFYERMHPPTLGATCGTAAIAVASMVYFSTIQSRPLLHEILIVIFVTVTTPVTFMLLARAAIYRDRAEQNPLVPPRERTHRNGSDGL